MKINKFLYAGVSLLALLVLTACKPPADTPSTSPDATPASSGGETAPVTAPETNAGGGTQAPLFEAAEPELAAEPDWEALKKELMARHQANFVAPKSGEKISLTLKSGVKKSGVLEKVEGDTVYMELEAGSIGYPRSALHPSSQVQLFAIAYGQYHAAKEWRAQRTDYETRKRAQEIAAAKASGAATVPVNDPAKNGAVWQVVEYLRDYVRNPETIRFKKWGKVQQVEAGYRVSLQYEFSTETMKNAVTHKWFLMDKSGAVYRTALYKE